MNDGDIAMQDLTDTAYGILQAGRLRMVKTEYISLSGLRTHALRPSDDDRTSEGRPPRA